MVDELYLDEPLSFWGGLDPATGNIVDTHHPQQGESIAGRRLVLPGTRGSTSSTGVLVEALRLGNGPVEIVMPAPDLTVLAAVTVARRLYGIDVPVRIEPDG
ncbi:MAG: DUF126 domain-containing protein [Woeseiaceae bacterium]|nr:DUF126 domain-containing protein [Woeseiaceae bacterium]